MNRWDRELADTIEAERQKRLRRTRHVCQQRGCIHTAHQIISDYRGNWRFCKRHAAQRRVHNGIVERIMGMKPR
jgi:hypothetical protein